MSGVSILVLVFACHAVCMCVLVEVAQAQSRPTTDPSEVRALNTIFQKWGISETKNWNISGEPCSGIATDGTPIVNQNYTLFIQCECYFDNGSTCHITQMKVFGENVFGPIPEELWTLTYLNNLDLRQNLLTGPLSPSIGNLTRLQYVSFGMNSLSGELPKEIGKLTELKSLSFGTNNFSGSLPPHMGNLSKLEQLYMSSSGVTGEIPSTFANLQSLQQVWIFDTELTGKIPDFIGNWTKLTALRLYGNAFEGPIPSTFSSLTSLTDLRLSDLPNGGSSLAFIKNMKSLTTLVLRNNNLSDSIPSDIGGYHNLKRLDLSFNSLHGQIPEFLFNMPSLSDLLLGSNKLTGALPSQLGASLQNIDLSYNNLSGSFPSWVSQPNLQLNLVANNFAVPRKSLTMSGLPSGFKCLQQNFPCNRGPGRYYKFSINCGGPQYKSSNNVSFERDNETLGAAAYYVTDTERWAVSNIGLFAESKNPQYTTNSAQQITNTSDPELFQSARLSPSSLRYYGLGLENGNYSVTLQFAELNFEPNNSWQSHGRRVFDIYIQGKLKIKNFDIRKEASEFSYVAVTQKFKGVMVSENYLDIHLFWAGKGTCCVPVHGTYGPSISAISATPEFDPNVSDRPPPESKNKTGLILGLVVSGTFVVLLSASLVFCLARRRRLTKDDNVLLGLDAKPYTFSYSELKTATGDFDSANKLGEGGFGPVYKGKLSDGRVVAVKQLAVASPQGKSQFLAEIATISAVQHRNLVKLYGCCIEEDNRLLVYEYLENKSLDQALFGKGGLHLNWPTRFDICLGIARGLSYLHEESRLRIVHRDVKASNILLDSNLNPKISDFGLAKLYDDQKTHMSTRVAGTIGYLAPEYAMRGHLTEKTDVFAFGVVALEIVSGRLNFDSNVEEEKAYLLEWAWQLHENDREEELVSSELVKFNEEEVKRVVGVALLCTQTSPMLRPPMSRVVAMLSGDIEVGTATSRPEYVTDLRYSDATSSMSSSTPTVKSDYQNLRGLSPEMASRPVLGNIIREGR